ncbi:MAG: glycosyltransferase family 4 protein [Hyphomicrobiales bacterium]|nr:glycosyltransferase family 4 protein [Hyphomicrobiales bacterium]
MSRTIRAATILQIIPHLDTGGAEMATVEICDAVTRAGGRALVFTEGGRMAGDVEQAGGIIVPFPAATKNPARIAINGLKLARIIRERGVDLIHARSRAPAWSALLAARRTGIAFVTTYHGAYGEGAPFKRFYNSVMARGQIVIANSNYTAKLVRERHETPESRIRVIPRGVDLAAFDPDAVSRARIQKLRRQWGVDARDRVVLHAARLTGWKGQRHVIDAAGALARAGLSERVAFILAGDPQGRESYAASLEFQIRALGLDGQVRLVGHCADMPAAFAAAHVALVASTEPEAFGRASAEAQAMGCPVIVTKQGASPETLLVDERDGKAKRTGWIVPVADAEALSNAVREALDLGEERRRAMGKRARAHVMEAFSSTQMKRDTLDVYDKLLRSALARSFDDAVLSGAGNPAP